MDSTVYLICFGVGLVFAIITTAMGHIFGGGHGEHLDGSGGHAEAGADASDMPGISALSPMMLSCFATAFGGLGMLLSRLEATRNPLLSAPLALAGAFGIAGGLLFLLRQMVQRTQGSSESKVGSLPGQLGTIISSIPANGVGEVAYVQSGTRYTAPAREEHGAAVASGQTVTITRVIGSQFYVKADSQK
jgi:membrane protein implicated in regulation of membrane protease activity